MKTEVNTSSEKEPTAGMAFQLSALLAQKVSALKLSHGQMKSLVDSPTKLAKMLQCLTGETVALPPIAYRTPTVSIEQTDHQVSLGCLSGSELNAIKPFIEIRGGALKEWETAGYDKLSKFAGPVYRCDINAPQKYFITTMREILDFHGSDFNLINLLEEYGHVWTIPQVLTLIRDEIDFNRDPLGLADFKKPNDYHDGPNEAWFLVKLMDQVTKLCPVLQTQVITEQAKIGLLSVTWKEFRRTKMWEVMLYPNDMYSFMSEHTDPTAQFGASGKVTSLFLLNDPRKRKDDQNDD